MMRLSAAVLVLAAAMATLECDAFASTAPKTQLQPTTTRPSSLSMTSTTQDKQEFDTTNDPRLEGLSLLLDDGTRKSHSMAESTQFVTGFFKGVSTKEAFSNLVASLYFVYKAMETSMDTISDASVQALDDDVLRRLPSLEQDLEFFYGSEWQDVIHPSPATQAYAARIEKVAQEQPYLLIGHQYSRYLGDLFGGQMMKGMATRSLNLENGKGVAFYQFNDIPDTKEYIAEWYTRLNNLDLTKQQKQEIVDEANIVFALNIGIFEELEGSSLQALWTMTVNTLKLKLGVA